MTARVRVRPDAVSLVAVDVSRWLVNRVLAPAQRHAVAEVNIDTGTLRASIAFGVEVEGGVPVGYLFATTNYALWQELEPGDDVPGGGVRLRPGGKPYLRPGVFRALGEATR